MKDILEAIVANKQKELEQWKQYVPLKQLYGIIEYEGAMKREVPSLKAALSGSSTIVVIAEFVRKTPALGWINKDAKIRNVGADYARCGATAISVPTDFTYFGGYDEFVQEARAIGITLPLMNTSCFKPNMQEHLLLCLLPCYLNWSNVILWFRLPISWEWR